jgi:hypothetical protein
MCFLGRAVAAFGISLVVAHVAVSPAKAARLCMVPVPLADPGNPRAHRALTHSARTIAFPGSPWPVFEEAGPVGGWELNQHGQLEISDQFPNNYLSDTFVVTPSNHVIGAGPYGKQVYIQDPANGRFVGLEGADEQTIGLLRTASWITGRRTTLIATSKGVFTLEIDGSTPTLKPMELIDTNNVNDVGRIYDLPLHRAAAFGTFGGRVFLLNSSENRLREVPDLQVGGRDWITNIREVEHPDRLLVQGSRQTWIVPLHRKGDATVPDKAREITSLKPDGSGGLQYYSAVQQFLVYGTPDHWFGPGRALLRLDDDLVAIESSRGLPNSLARYCRG